MTHFLTLGFLYVYIFVYLLQYEHISSNDNKNFKLNDLTLHYSYTMANVKTVKKYIVKYAHELEIFCY